MTVSIAAFARNRSRIVLMTDRQFTGDYKIEAEKPKAVFLPNGWMATYCGDRTFAHETANAAVPLLQGITDPYVIADKFHDGLNLHWARVLDRDYRSQQLTGEDADRILDELTEGACDFLLCGFAENSGWIFRIGLGRHDEVMDFAAIGSGEALADNRLGWRTTRSSDRLPRVVYEVYEAKRQAERDPNVGELMDFWVIGGEVSYRKQPDGSVGVDGMAMITKASQDFLREWFEYFDQTPFERALRDGETKKARPTGDWEADLDDRLKGVL